MRFIYYIFYFVLLIVFNLAGYTIVTSILSFFLPMWSYSLFVCGIIAVYCVLINPFISWYTAESLIKVLDIENRIL